ncbi:hypothetical protein EDEG_02454 [Edhazardia aedis USNM 41457]|uniref:Uncharacterized protein n=1 Tax=Edhazardia aedis (strain USNM 41457) TaxID=1003232 RepID=J9D6K8_EDHAE|nr:hypothetical protein EDEG_02454 [Edhazardia aedis USNM 41457]|eukprot:EJW03149.1 hypothetical protein EDEG_02454 [Edhazardia aedis USNM 41457]
MDTSRHEGKGNGDQLNPTSRRNPGSGSSKKYNKDLSTTNTHLYCLYTLFASRVNQSPLTYGNLILDFIKEYICESLHTTTSLPIVQNL